MRPAKCTAGYLRRRPSAAVGAPGGSRTQLPYSPRRFAMEESTESGEKSDYNGANYYY